MQKYSPNYVTAGECASKHNTRKTFHFSLISMINCLVQIYKNKATVLRFLDGLVDFSLAQKLVWLFSQLVLGRCIQFTANEIRIRVQLTIVGNTTSKDGTDAG